MQEMQEMRQVWRGTSEDRVDDKVAAVLELTQAGFWSRCQLKIGLGRGYKWDGFPTSIATLLYPPAFCTHIDLGFSCIYKT